MSEPTQLSLFVPQLDDRIRRVEIDGILHFSILDTFEYSGSAGSKLNPAAYWARAKKRLLSQGGNVTGVLDWRPDGQSGGKPTPVAPFKFFLRLAQVVEIAEWEHIRVWMADVAHERLEEQANPGLGTARAYRRDLALMERVGLGHVEAAERLRMRIDVVDTYKSLTAHIARVCDNKAAFGATINREYLYLFGKMADELKDILHTKNIRDALPELQLSYIKVAELNLTALLKRKDTMSIEQLLAAVMVIVKPLGEHLQAISDMLGVDLITGQPLLKGK
jgi:hypothetical protein